MELPLTPDEGKAYWCGRYLLELLELGVDVLVNQFSDCYKVKIRGLPKTNSTITFDGETLTIAFERAVKFAKGEGNEI